MPMRIFCITSNWADKRRRGAHSPGSSAALATLRKSATSQEEGLKPTVPVPQETKLNVLQEANHESQDSRIFISG